MLQQLKAFVPIELTRDDDRQLFTVVATGKLILSEVLVMIQTDRVGLYGMARMHQTLAGDEGIHNIRVFKTRAAAQEWLDSHA